MKAWYAWNEYTGYATVVFAETRGQAKSVAMYTDTFDGDWDFTEIRVYRRPKLDAEYRGRDEMDWDNDADRLALIKHGFSCHDDVFDTWYCERCAGKDICDKYQDYLRENAGSL